jgi:hypothetical protein
VCLCCSLAPPCCVLLLLIGTSLLCVFYVHFVPPYCALLLLIGTSLLCTHIAHWHLLVVCSCCSLAPPCYVFFMCTLYLLIVRSCCSLAPLCCALTLLIGTSLLCAFDVLWSFSNWYFTCAFFCVNVEEDNFQLFFQLQSIFLIFKKNSIAYFFEVLFFSHFFPFVIVSHFLLSYFAFKDVSSIYFLIFVFILMKHISEKIIIHINYLTCCVCCVMCRIKTSLAQKKSHIKTFFPHLWHPRYWKCL